MGGSAASTSSGGETVRRCESVCALRVEVNVGASVNFLIAGFSYTLRRRASDERVERPHRRPWAALPIANASESSPREVATVMSRTSGVKSGFTYTVPAHATVVLNVEAR